MQPGAASILAKDRQLEDGICRLDRKDVDGGYEENIGEIDR